MNIPVYRAKKLCDGEYIEFKTYFEENGKYRAVVKFAKQEIEGWLDKVYIPLTFRIDPSTLSINFKDMIDSQGNKIFASLSKDGKGGSLVVSKHYPFYGDAPGIRDSNGKCEELNYKGLICFSSNGVYLDYIKVSDRVRGNVIGGVIEDFEEYEVIGIQE